MTPRDSVLPDDVHSRQQMVLDLIARLGKEGCAGDFDLPQIIVCGDQSSGKSSVLESISHVPFPTKDTLCTRFPTELIMRQAARGDSQLTVSIVPSSKRAEKEKQKLRAFKSKYNKLEDVSAVIQEAQKAMGLENTLTRFTEDILRIEISGPLVPNLTLVDLPGFFHSNALGQNVDDADQVEELVLSYMSRPRSIILAIVSAKADLAQQVVTKFAKQMDPTGDRTIGVITKPDTLDDSPNLAQLFFEVAQNKHPVLKFSTWHVLRNKKLSEQGMEWKTFFAVQDEFFNKGIWQNLSGEQKGISSFKSRLADVLFQHIVACAAPLAKDVHLKVKELEQRLAELSASGKSATSMEDLFNASISFTNIVEDGTSGQYSSDFLRSQNATTRLEFELRSRIEDQIADFGERVSQGGHSWQLADDVDETASDTVDDVIMLSRKDFMELIADRLGSSRALPGQFDAILLSELFYDQAQKWVIMVEDLRRGIDLTIEKFVLAAMEHIVGSGVGEQLYEMIIKPAWADVVQQMTDSIEEKFHDHKKRKEIKFPKAITDLIETARQEELGRIVEEFNQEHSDVSKALGTPLKARVGRGTPKKKSASLASYFTTERSTCAELLVCLEAYYATQLQKLLMTFDLQRFETHYLSKLPNLFNFTAVKSLRPSQLKLLTNGTDAERAEREQLNVRLANLWSSYKELGELVTFKGKPAQDEDAIIVTAERKRAVVDEDSDKRTKKRRVAVQVPKVRN